MVVVVLVVDRLVVVVVLVVVLIGLLMQTEQSLPLQFGGHTQVKPKEPADTQVPPFLHGFGTHEFSGSNIDYLNFLKKNNFFQN